MLLPPIVKDAPRVIKKESIPLPGCISTRKARGYGFESQALHVRVFSLKNHMTLRHARVLTSSRVNIFFDQKYFGIEWNLHQVLKRNFGTEYFT